MELAIDLRLRPPVGAFLSLAQFDPASGLPIRLEQRGYTVPSSYRERSMDALFAEMDEAGIGRALVVARAPGRLGAVSNPDAAAVVEQYPRRLVGFLAQVACNLPQAERDVEEAEHLGATGISIEPGLGSPPRLADDASLLPIYELAAQHQLPIFVTGGDSGPDTSFASPLALEHAAGDVPGAVFVAAHGGWPFVREMVAVALRRPNVWVLPDMYAARFPGHAEYVELANGLLRERMVFGTSYPAVNIAQYVSSLRSDGLTDAAWRAIAIDNPQRLLGVRLRGHVEIAHEGEKHG